MEEAELSHVTRWGGGKVTCPKALIARRLRLADLLASCHDHCSRTA